MITLPEVLSSLTVPDLKQLMALLPEAPSAGRKDEIIRTLVCGLSLSGLVALWERLDEQERLAVGEALYATNGVFDPIQFQAKHGCLPVFKTEIKRYHPAPTLLSLFLFACGPDRCVPVDLHESLKSFVPVPKPTMLATVETPPASLNDTAMTVRLTEHEAFAELAVMLRLVEEGKMQVSDKTSMPTASTLRILANHLVGGDFYPDEPPRNTRGDRIGPIKPFAWLMLLLGAGLAQRKGTRLALTKDGQKAMANFPAEMIRSIWRRWIDSTLLDEFSRVDMIKGQKAKRRVMTPVRKRRETIAWVLSLCPADKWISVEELSRYMRATGHRFDVTNDPWALYLFHSDYGSFGYSGSHGWNVLQHRYILCLLFEYAATLGMIDVAHIDPEVTDTMLLVKCQDQTTAEFIATHKLNVGLCQHVGELKLIVPLEKKEKFKLFARKLGFGMPE